MVKEEIKKLILQGEQPIDTIITDYVLQNWNNEKQTSDFVFTLHDLQEIVVKPSIKVQFYLYQIIVLFIFAQKKEEEDPFDSETFNDILLYLRLALPTVASMSDTGTSEFMETIERYANSIFPQTLLKLEVEVGYAVKEDVEVEIKHIEQKRRYYGNAIKVKIANPEEESAESPKLFKKRVMKPTLDSKSRKTFI